RSPPPVEPSENAMAQANALTKLEQALKANRAEVAFAALAQAWSQTPAPELLELATRLQAAFPVAPFAGDHASWLNQPAKPTYVERGARPSNMRTNRLQDMAERIRAVAAWSPDPRTSLFVEQLIRDAPYTSDSSKKMWKDAFLLMGGLAEPRFVSVIDE